jgi:hypothetical protein
MEGSAGGVSYICELRSAHAAKMIGSNPLALACRDAAGAAQMQWLQEGGPSHPGRAAGASALPYPSDRFSQPYVHFFRLKTW